MSQNHVNIDNLFEQARSIETQVSFDQTKKAFLTTLLLSAGGVLASKGVLKLLTTKKWLIMMSVITSVTTASIVGVMSFSPKVEEGSLLENSNPNPEFTTKELVVGVPEEKENEKQEKIQENQPIRYSDIEIIETENFTDIGDFTIYQELFNDDTIKVNADGNFQKEDIKAYSQRFVISSETTVEDLEQMKILAEKAGIKLNYKVRIKQNKLKSIALHTEIKERNNHQTMSITSDDFKDDDAPMIFGWYADDKGKATEMGFGDESNVRCSTGRNTYEGCKHNSHEIHMDDFDHTFHFNNDLFDSCDSLNVMMTEEMTELLYNLEVELEVLEEQIENRKETIDLSGVNDILREVNAESKELFNMIEEELNSIFTEIKEKDREKKVEQ